MPIGFGSSTLGFRKLMTSGIVQDKHLMLWYDYQYPQCYPKTGTAITNLAPERTGLHSATLSINTGSYNQGSNIGSFLFDGIASSISVLNTSSSEWERNSELTVESWVRTTNYLSVDGDASQNIIQRGSSALDWDLQSVNSSGGTLGGYRFRNDGGNVAVASSTNLVTNTWYHVAATRHLVRVGMPATSSIGLYGRGLSNPTVGGSDLFHTAPNSGQRITTFSNNTFSKGAFSGDIFGAFATISGLTSSTTPTAGTNDDGYWALALPFAWNFLGETVATVYIGSNGYITFSPDIPTAVFSPSSIDDLRMPRINLFAADNSCQRIYYGIVGTTPNRVFRVQWEGTNASTGTLGSPSITYQIDFLENSINTFDLRIGSNARVTPTYTMYINGVLNSINSPTANRIRSGGINETKIGNYLGSDSFSYRGDIAIQRIYNRRLLEGEILSNYNAEKTRFGYT